MSILKKSATIAPPTVIANYGFILGGINLVEDSNTTQQIAYGTILTITSVDDVSNVVFSLKGSFNGVNIEEEIVGPNQDAVNSVYFYDKITSLVASVDDLGAITLSTGNKSIVVFDSYNTTNANNINYNNINVLARSITAGADWGQALANNGDPIGYFVYGISTERPSVISNSYVMPSIVAPGVGYPNNPYLTFINDIQDNITQNEIQNGVIVGTTYPYRSVIIYISGVLQSLTFIEIAQS